MQKHNSEIKRREDLKGLLNVLCILQLLVMLVLIYGNITVSDKTKDMRIAVEDMKAKVEQAQVENYRLQQEKALIFQRAVKVSYK